MELWQYSSNWTTVTSTYVQITDNPSEIMGTSKLVENTAYFQVKFTLPLTANSSLTLNNIKVFIQ